MRESSKERALVRCACGSVEFEALGAPILSTACYCNDCQEGARRIEALPNARPILGPDGGTAYLLYRKDRFQCSKGAEYLRDYMIRSDSPTRRVVASCCNSGMFLDFRKGHWFSAYSIGFVGDISPLEMRVQAQFAPDPQKIPNDVPVYSAYPFRFIARLMLSRFAMLLRR